MSSFVGKLTAAVGAIQNENSLSLANVNFDFTLIKYEAPKEFSGLGTALSKQRKINAEDGALHRTARKLGALFEGRLPATPALYKAYGTRVSEISLRPDINPQASEKGGFFASHLGIDAGSIWAAVTSGDEAIAVHLLACMLARSFTGPEATSVWVELVEKQKQRIREDHSESMYAHKLNAAMLAAEQEISRIELGNWDASARAWLPSADQAKERQHKQLMLILENVGLLVNNEQGVYESVMKAWTTALQAMNNLVKGIPQQVQDGAALLGISSWHLYPDMVVLGGKMAHVEQGDSLFGGTAILTLGLQTVGESHSVSWSLPLASLRYYGQPVPTYGSVGPDNSRITLEQFGFFVLGCVFSRWQEFGKTPQIAASWLHKILELIHPNVQKKIPHNEFNSHWLNYLEHSATSLLNCTDMDMKFTTQLLNLGKRRSNFICPSIIYVPPLFGLSDIRTLLHMMVSDEIRVGFLRKFAYQLNLNERYFIRYKPTECSRSHQHRRYEYATISPEGTSAKRTYHGLSKAGSVNYTTHKRWLPFQIDQFDDCECLQASARRPMGGTGCTCDHSPWMFVCSSKQCDVDGECDIIQHTPFWLRYETLKQTKEPCLPVLEEDNEDGISLRFAQGSSFENVFRKLEAEKSRFGAKRPNSTFKVNLKFLVGDRSSAAIYFAEDDSSGSGPSLDSTLRPQDLEGVLSDKILDVELVSEHILNSEQAEFISLKYCAAVADVYKLMPDATISTKALVQQITSAHWAINAQTRFSVLLTRPQTFSCIAKFDSGTCDLDPTALQDVFAMSSENSIYVSGALLCDPYEETRPKEIRRVTGNIGRAGVSLLMGLPLPEIRAPEIENWKQINHLEFHGVPEDCFTETSVHLSFTGYDLPLMTQRNDRHIDRPANLIETRLSAYDRGKWVGDIDFTRYTKVPESRFNYHVHRLVCEGHTSARRRNECMKRPRLTFEEVLSVTPRLNGTSIDNWDELLEAPPVGTLFVRAHNNWLARLALTRVCVQLGFKVIILPNDEVCWPCCA